MVSWVSALLFVMANSFFARANDVKCDLQVSPHVQAATKILTDALALKDLSLEEVATLASSKKPFNPFARQTLVLENQAFRKGFARHLAAFREDDNIIFQTALKKILNGKRTENAVVKTSREKTSHVFSMEIVREPLFSSWKTGFEYIRMGRFEGRPIFMGTLRSPTEAYGQAYVFDPFGTERVRFLRVQIGGRHQMFDQFRLQDRNLVGVLDAGNFHDLDANAVLHWTEAGFAQEMDGAWASLTVRSRRGEDLFIVNSEGVYRHDLTKSNSRPVLLHNKPCWCLEKYFVEDAAYISCVTAENQVLIYDVVGERMLPSIAGKGATMANDAIGLFFRENGRTFVAFNTHSYSSPSNSVEKLWNVRIMDLETRETRDFSPDQRTSIEIKFMFIRGEPYAYYSVRGNLYFKNLLNEKYWKIEEGGQGRTPAQTFILNGRDYLLWGTNKGKVFVYDIESAEVMATRDLGGFINGLLVTEYQGNVYALVGASDSPPLLLRVAVPDGGRE